MPKPNYNIWLSDSAIAGLRRIAATRGLQNFQGLARALKEISKQELIVHDDRPQYIKDSDTETRPKIWNSDDQRRPRHLGDLPIAFLLELAEHFEIYPFQIQRGPTRGFSTKRGIPWFIPDRLARFSTESRISAVLEAIGIGYLRIDTKQMDTDELRARRYADAQRSLRQRRVWVGGFPTDPDDARKH